MYTQKHTLRVDDILIRNRKPSARYLHHVIMRRVQFDYGTCHSIASSCLCKDDAFDVPDVYIWRRIYSAITALKLHYHQDYLHICLPTFDARRLFANRFRREFAGRIN